MSKICSLSLSPALCVEAAVHERRNSVTHLRETGLPPTEGQVKSGIAVAPFLGDDRRPGVGHGCFGQAVRNGSIAPICPATHDSRNGARSWTADSSRAQPRSLDIRRGEVLGPHFLLRTLNRSPIERSHGYCATRDQHRRVAPACSGGGRRSWMSFAEWINSSFLSTAFWTARSARLTCCSCQMRSVSLLPNDPITRPANNAGRQ